MRYFRKFGRRRVMRKRGVRKGGYKRKVSKSVKRYVKRAIHRSVENKEVINYAANIGLQGAQSGIATPNVVGLIPALGQGVTEVTRIGNQIKLVSGTIRGYVNILPYNAVTNPSPPPVWIKIWIVRHLGINGQVTSPATTLDWTNFFRGNATALGFQNNTLDLTLPINDAYWKVEMSKTFRIGAASYSSSGPVSSGAYFDNSPMSHSFYFNFGKKCKKIWKFNDTANSNLPTNENLYMVIQPVNADGSSTTVPAEYHYTTLWKFEDA